MSKPMPCPCNPDRNYKDCCEPYLKREAIPETAEQLMRSRYSAYVNADIDYIKRTLVPEQRENFDEAGARAWAESSKWNGLRILSTEQGGPEDKKGVVEFVATFEDSQGQTIEHHEVSKFRKNDQGHWLFIDGESRERKPQAQVQHAPKIGRNDPCHCGSGQKFKKCHGKQ